MCLLYFSNLDTLCVKLYEMQPGDARQLQVHKPNASSAPASAGERHRLVHRSACDAAARWPRAVEPAAEPAVVDPEAAVACQEHRIRIESMLGNCWSWLCPKSVRLCPGLPAALLKACGGSFSCVTRAGSEGLEEDTLGWPGLKRTVCKTRCAF